MTRKANNYHHSHLQGGKRNVQVTHNGVNLTNMPQIIQDSVQDSLGIAGQSQATSSGKLKRNFFGAFWQAKVTQAAARALDVCCAIALMHKWFDGHVAEVHGVDMSEESLTEAQKNNRLHALLLRTAKRYLMKMRFLISPLPFVFCTICRPTNGSRLSRKSSALFGQKASLLSLNTTP